MQQRRLVVRHIQLDAVIPVDAGKQRRGDRDRDRCQRQRRERGDHAPPLARVAARVGKPIAVEHGRLDYAGRPFISPARRHVTTTSPRWLIASCRNSTIPWPGRDFDARTETTVVRARIVSPWNTGLGNLTSCMPRLPTVVPSVVSPTVIPISSPSVNSELTSGLPNSLCVRANSKSMCNGCGFIVSVENSTLSISVMVRPSACSNTMPSRNSSNHRPGIASSPLRRHCEEQSDEATQSRVTDVLRADVFRADVFRATLGCFATLAMTIQLATTTQYDFGRPSTRSAM